eukprot:UN01818
MFKDVVLDALFDVSDNDHHQKQQDIQQNNNTTTKTTTTSTTNTSFNKSKNQKIINELLDDKTLLLLTKCDTLPFTDYNIDTSTLSSSKQLTADPLYLNSQTTSRAQF